MNKNHYNLTLRFILEMLALFMAAYWGWVQNEGWLRVLLVAGLPIGLALTWGIFAVPGDPSRSGKTVVATPGWIRLILELLIFGFAAWTFYDLDFSFLSSLFLLLVILHYSFSFDRIKWLLKQ